jgi:hypothetical protein
MIIEFDVLSRGAEWCGHTKWLRTMSLRILLALAGRTALNWAGRNFYVTCIDRHEDKSPPLPLEIKIEPRKSVTCAQQDLGRGASRRVRPVLDGREVDLLLGDVPNSSSSYAR